MHCTYTEYINIYTNLSINKIGDYVSYFNNNTVYNPN